MKGPQGAETLPQRACHSRRLPIFDTVGHNPYPVTNSERPWVRHPSGGTISQGDYEKLMWVLGEAFAGTGQPLPGQKNVAVWYMEQGFQTAVDPAKAGLYKGTESDRQVLPAWVGRAGSAVSGPAPDQASQLSDALQLAYCQPGVAAFFNFELADEVNLGGWQSGLLWTDLTPKPSYQTFRDTVRRLNARAVDCSLFTGGTGFSTK